MGFARFGPSLGGALSLGGEATIQKGSLDDFEGTNDINQNPVEVEAGAAVGVNVVLDATNRDLKPIGLGGNRGAGGGVAFNLTKDTATTGTFNIYDQVKRIYRRVKEVVNSVLP